MRRVAFALPFVLASACAAHESDDARASRAAESDACPRSSHVFDSIAYAVGRASGERTLPQGAEATTRNRADARVFVDPYEIFEKAAALVESAEHEVALQTYLLHVDSDPTKTLLAAIARLHARLAAGPPRDKPVVVRMLLDTSDIGINGGRTPVATLATLTGALLDLKLDPRLVTFELATHVHDDLDSLHAKTLVVDGRVALVTSANMAHANDYDYGEYDAGFVFEGQVARSLLAEHDDAWARSKTWDLRTCGRNWGPPAPSDPKSARSLAPCFDPPRPIVHDFPEPAPPAACAPALVVGRPWGDGTDDTQSAAFTTAIAASKRIVRLRSPNLNARSVEDRILEALARAPTLVVQVLLSKGYEDFAEGLDDGTNAEVVARLYDGARARGIVAPCERLQIRWWSAMRDGRTAVVGGVDREARVNRAGHVKYASFDDEVAIVGSTNLDNQSWSRSREVDVVLHAPDVVHAWDAAIFDRDFDGAVVTSACGGPPDAD